jgi:hypothetical protein
VAATKCRPRLGWNLSATWSRSRTSNALSLNMNERLAAANPAQKESLLALLSAGRMCLRKLNRPADTLRNYKAAQASTIPHLDWEANNQHGNSGRRKGPTVCHKHAQVAER